MIRRAILLASTVLALAVSAAPAAHASPYFQVNLVSDVPGLAKITDSDLANPWGVSHSATSPFWVSDQGANVSTLYSVTGSGAVSKNALTVSIPTTATGPQGPTGQVVNGTSSFVVNGAPARFIFANLNGTISAWNGSLGTTAQIVATGTPAVYTALALAGTNLYAVNAALGTIDVYDGTFANVTASFAGKFVNPDLPAGLEPFNVQEIGGNLYVTYAPAGRPAQIAADTGEGAVAVFDAAGNFINQIVAGSQLAAPWGIALAPADFGVFGGDLLVGNFSFEHSEINAFDPATGLWQGVIPVKTGTEDAGGLWALSFGIGGNNGDPRTLYITDGINGESNGLFAAIAPVPEPGTLLMVVAGLLAALGIRKRQPIAIRN